MTQVQVNTKIHSVAKERLGRICLSAGFGYPISNAWRGGERRRAIVRELHTTHAFLGRRRRRNTRSNYQKGRKRSGVFSYGRTKNTLSGRTCKRGILKSSSQGFLIYYSNVAFFREELYFFRHAPCVLSSLAAEMRRHLCTADATATTNLTKTLPDRRRPLPQNGERRRKSRMDNPRLLLLLLPHPWERPFLPLPLHPPPTRISNFPPLVWKRRVWPPCTYSSWRKGSYS